jgi:hypothetical protein
MSNEFWQEVEGLILTPEIPAIEYRLYYNDRGEIIHCSMTDHSPGDNYIVTDKDTYGQYYNFRVVAGKLEKIDRMSVYRVQLKLSSRGYATVKNHAGIILEPGEYSNNIDFYEPNN